LKRRRSWRTTGAISTADRLQHRRPFRKFAQGLTLDNLVWLANQQLNRLHGRYLLQRKASEALELEVVDTWQADAGAIPAPSPAAKASSSAWRWPWRCPIW
jgi:hypothetical protein